MMDPSIANATSTYIRIYSFIVAVLLFHDGCREEWLRARGSADLFPQSIHGECASLNFHLYFIHSSCIFHGYLTGSVYYLSMKQKIDPDIIFFVALILFVFFILRT